MKRMLRVPLSLRIILLVIITSTVLVGGLLMTVYKLMINDYQALVMERECQNRSPSVRA
ncbi:hypothetical protein ACT691_10800 [Vibrio metschnikovii]